MKISNQIDIFMIMILSLLSLVAIMPLLLVCVLIGGLLSLLEQPFLIATKYLTISILKLLKILSKD